VQVPASGGDDPHIDGTLGIGADGFDGPRLERSEQRELHAGRGVANLIEQERAALRGDKRVLLYVRSQRNERRN